MSPLRHQSVASAARWPSRPGWGWGNESYPDLFQPYGGFPDGVKVDNGHVVLPDLLGIGFEGKADLMAEMRALSGSS